MSIEPCTSGPTTGGEPVRNRELDPGESRAYDIDVAYST